MHLYQTEYVGQRQQYFWQCIQSNKDTGCQFIPDMSRFSFSKRCICTVVKYVHQQGFSIAIEEKGGETQGLGEYNIVQRNW